VLLSVVGDKDTTGRLFVEFWTERGFPLKHSGWLYYAADSVRGVAREREMVQRVPRRGALVPRCRLSARVRPTLHNRRQLRRSLGHHLAAFALYRDTGPGAILVPTHNRIGS
jgi:hypothetical protein